MLNLDIINKKYHKLENYVDKFKSAEPFPFIVLDNFLKEDYFYELQNFISIENAKNKNKGKDFNTVVENNKWISKNSNLPENIRIGAILRKNDIIIPSSKFIFKKKDIVVFLAKKDQLPVVENLFRISSI